MNRDKGKDRNQQRPRPEAKLWSIEDLAHVLGISPRTIRNRLDKNAKRPFPIKPLRLGRLVRFDPADVDAYIVSLKEQVK